MHGRRDASAWQARAGRPEGPNAALPPTGHAGRLVVTGRLFPPEQAAELHRSAKEVNAMSRGPNFIERAGLSTN